MFLVGAERRREPPTASREHLSIGEVLAELQRRVPRHHDLEDPLPREPGSRRPRAHAVGLPEVLRRTTSRACGGSCYQQKEHFLPLKVIKERLDELPPGEEARLLDARTLDAGAAPPRRPERVRRRADAGRRRRPPRTEPSAGTAPRPAPCAARPDGARVRAHAAARRRRARRPRSSTPAATRTYSRSELAAAAGLDDAQVARARELRADRRRPRGRRRRRATTTTRSRSRASRPASSPRGVEARHLRMYRTFAEREAVLFGQVLLPYVRQRNPEARARLQEELVELADARAPAADRAPARRGARDARRVSDLAGAGARDAPRRSRPSRSASPASPPRSAPTIPTASCSSAC